MDLKIRDMWLPENKYYYKSPRITPKTSLTVHNTGNSASAEQEARYMINNMDSQTSFHAVADKNEVIRIIPFERVSFHCGKRAGNNSSYSLEIAGSTGNIDDFLKAEDNAAKYIAIVFNQKGWGSDELRTHKMWSGKNCPHKTLELGWNRFVNKVKKYLNEIDNLNININTEIKNNSKGDFISMKWKNGRTSEIVYSDSRRTNKIGIISPYEEAVCIGEMDGSYIVEYIVDNTWNGENNNNKVGYVAYNGGVKL